METGRKTDAGLPEMRRALDREQAVRLAADGILSAAYQFWPQVILLVSAFFLPEAVIESLRRRGHKIVVLHSEAPYEDEQQLKRAAWGDINLLNDPANIDAFRAICPESHYMPHAYRPGFHKPGPVIEGMRCDLAFNGTGFQSRIEFFEKMLPGLQGLDVMLTGNWQALEDDSPLNELLAHEKDRCLDNEQAVSLYRSARAGLNLYRQEALDANAGQGWAMGPREIELAATGLFFLRDRRPESDEVLWMLPSFDSPGDAAEKLRWWLDPARDSRRADAALGARRAIAGRTFPNHAAELLRMLDRLPARV